MLQNYPLDEYSDLEEERFHDPLCNSHYWFRLEQPTIQEVIELAQKDKIEFFPRFGIGGYFKLKEISGFDELEKQELEKLGAPKDEPIYTLNWDD